MLRCDSYDIELRRGDCFDFSTVRKADGKLVDLTGFAAEIAFHWSATKTTAAGKVSYSSDGTHIAPLGVDGLIKVHLSITETNAIPPPLASKAGTSVTYQIRLIDIAGCIKTHLSGRVVTRNNNFEA